MSSPTTTITAATVLDVQSVPAITTRTCETCHVSRELTRFGRLSSSLDGVAYICKHCCRAYDKINWQRTSINSCRTKDRRRWKEEVDDFGERLTVKQVNYLLEIQEGRCKYCSAVMVYGLDINRRTHPRGLTIERADNDVPHVITNCVLACNGCNKKRGASYTYEEFQQHHAEIKLNLVKKCQSYCGEIQPTTAFHHRNQSGGYYYACKICRKVINAARRAAKPY